MSRNFRRTGSERRAERVRSQIAKRASGRARLSIFRSGKHIYAQIIDDAKGVTVASASSVDKDVKGKVKNGSTVETAKIVGQLVAERAVKAEVKEVVFDRGAFRYHGRVKALADAARESGLAF